MPAFILPADQRNDGSCMDLQAGQGNAKAFRSQQIMILFARHRKRYRFFSLQGCYENKFIFDYDDASMSLLTAMATETESVQYLL